MEQLPTSEDYLSIAEAALLLEGKPWDVVRLLEARQVEFIQLVDRASLVSYIERNSA